MQCSSLSHEEVENLVLDANCGWAVEVMCQFGLCMCPPEFQYCINREEKPATTEKQILIAELNASSKKNYRPKQISRRHVNIQISISNLDGADEEKMNMASNNRRHAEEKIILSKSSHDYADIASQFTLPSLEVESPLANQPVENEGDMFCLPSLPTDTPKKIDNKQNESNEDSKVNGPILGFLAVHDDTDSTDALSISSSYPNSPQCDFDDGTKSLLMEKTSPPNLTDHKIEPSLERLCYEIAQMNLNFKYFEQNITSLIERKFDSLLAQFDLENGNKLHVTSNAKESPLKQKLDTPTLIPPLPERIRTSDRRRSFHPYPMTSGQTPESNDRDVFVIPRLSEPKSTAKNVSNHKSKSGDNLFEKISGRLENFTSVSEELHNY